MAKGFLKFQRRLRGDPEEVYAVQILPLPRSTSSGWDHLIEMNFCHEDWVDDYADSVGHWINKGFNWSSSEQGQRFWYSVYNNLTTKDAEISEKTLEALEILRGWQKQEMKR